MAKLRIKKGDTVLVITGKDKGLTGKVIASYPDTDRLLVEGVNRVKKHTKIAQAQGGGKSGGIITQEAPIHVSNVMLVTKQDGKEVGTRIGFRTDAKGNKVRVAKRTGEDI